MNTQFDLLNTMLANALKGNFQGAPESDFDPELKPLYHNIQQMIETHKNYGSKCRHPPARSCL